MNVELNSNSIPAQGVRTVGGAIRIRQCGSIPRTAKVLENDRPVRGHARFPLRTATSSPSIDTATSGGLFPPMSKPIGV